MRWTLVGCGNTAIKGVGRSNFLVKCLLFLVGIVAGEKFTCHIEQVTLFSVQPGMYCHV